MTPEDLRRKRIRSFVTLAEREPRAAEPLVSELPGEAVFQARQSVEKPLRAVVEAEDKRAGTTDNIRDLAGVIGTGHELHQRFPAFDDLSAAATRYRYPSGSGGLAVPPSAAELTVTFAAIESLRTDVIRFLDARRLYVKG